MIKLRLEGIPEFLDIMMESLKKHYKILSVSQKYKNRNSVCCRVYVELEVQ